MSPTTKGSFVGLMTLSPWLIACWTHYGLGYSVLYNATHSLPHTFFVYNAKQRHAALKVGDFVLFNHKASVQPIVKKVAGVHGDVIVPENKRLRLNNCHFLLKGKDSYGRPLKPLQDKSVPVGKVFVAGDHTDSLDSRYDTFGLIDTYSVKGVVWPIF